MAKYSLKMIYTDGVHIISNTSVEELHNFADYVGISAINFRDRVYPHYDIPSPSLRRRTLFAGAKLVPVKKLLDIVKTDMDYAE